MGIFDRLKNRERTPQEQDAPGTGSPFMPPEGAPMGGPPASYQQVTGKLIGTGAFGQAPGGGPLMGYEMAVRESMAAPVIGKEQIQEAMRTLRRYKAGKANLERRIIENEEFWKLRHWEHIPEKGTTQLKTKSAWLVNVILSKHADAMDAIPEANFLPRE